MQPLTIKVHRPPLAGMLSVKGACSGQCYAVFVRLFFFSGTHARDMTLNPAITPLMERAMIQNSFILTNNLSP